MADRKIDDFIGGLTIRDLYITQFVPPGLTYIAGSANVPPKRVARTLDARTRLDWEWKQIRSTAPQTITYQAKPLAEGTWEITGTMKLVDTRSLAREVVMASQPVTVSGLCLPPSPTPSPTDPPTPTAIPTHTPLPTPTSTATPTATPTPVPTATPTATPTPEPGPLYLPLLLHERCTPDQRRVDVALVIDASSSMTEPTAIGRTKLDAARQAAGAFLDQLRFDRGDQAAIVAFNAASTLLQPLGGDRAALGGALDRVQVAQQTCIVCGLETALAELSSPRRVAGHTPTVILLTDGRSNPRPVGEAVARAAEGKARGVVVFTIGLGRDVEEAELAAMASGPGYYHHAPDAEALAGIYRRIAVDLPCPAEQFWGGR